MSVWAIIPIKAPHECKTRLRPVFSDQERQEIAKMMLGRVLNAATHAYSVERVSILGPSRHGFDETLPLVEDAGGGLNAALTAALSAAPAKRVIVLAADLPNLTSADVEALADAASNTVLVAPDRAGTGTNALSLPLPAARDFRFCFGENSFASHCAEAKRLGLAALALHSPSIGLDIDTADDAAAAGLLPR